MKRRWSELKLAGPIVLLIVLTGSMPLMVIAASATGYHVAISPPDAELVLTFSSPPTYKVRQTQRGQVLDFDRALDFSDLATLSKSLSVWVRNISASFDALLLQLQPGVTVDLTVKGNNLHIIFNGVAGNDLSVLDKPKSGLALDRVETLLMLESGHSLAAAARLKELMEKHPDKTQLLLDLAHVEEKLGNWREALALYERAEALMPYSSVIKMAKTRLLRAYGSRFTTGATHSQVGSDNTQVIGTVQSRKLMINGYVWSLDYEFRDAEVNFDVRRTNGDLTPFDGQRHSLALGLELAFNSGVDKFTLFAGAKDLGFRWAHTRAGDYGRGGIEMEWGVPWYETPEALAGYGYKNRLALNYNNLFQNKLSLTSDISFNRYALDNVDNAAESYRFQLYTRYWFLTTGSGFSLGYALDMESVTTQAERIDSLGNIFNPLPLDSREQHIIDLGWKSKLGNSFFLGTQLGYEYDQKRNVSAPFGRLVLNYQPDSSFEASVNIQTGLSTYRGGDDEFFSIGGNVSWFI